MSRSKGKIAAAIQGILAEPMRRLGYLIHRNRHGRELADEMAFHREMAQRAGRPASSFGSQAALREQAREAWGWTWIDRLGQDLRYTARTLARSPGFTVAAVFILAVGVGVNVAAFSMFDISVLKPLPIRDPDSLRRLERRSEGNIAGWMPYPTAVFYRDHAKSLATVLTLTSGRVEVEDDVQPVRANFVSANFLSDLGAKAVHGRLLDPARDEAAGAPPVAVLGYHLWQTRFASDPNIVGATIRVNRKPVTVIGIEPYAFSSLGESYSADVWIPITQQPHFVEGSKILTDTANGSVVVWGRLARGVTPKMAEAELLGLTNELRKLHPDEIWKGEYIYSEPGGRLAVLNPRMAAAAWIFGTLTLLILAVACANLGGLLLARGVGREHEVSIRLAIGASRKRIFRQLFTESIVLALLGSAAGLAMACFALRLVVFFIPADGPKWLSFAPDWWVILFTLSVALLASLFFGLTPALQLARQKRKGTLIRKILVAAQVAASCVLLIVSSSMVHGAEHLIYSDPGFGYQQVISIAPGLSDHDYKPAAAQAYFEQLQSRLRALPGVAAVSLVKMPPLGRTISRMDSKANGVNLEIYPNWVTPDFFRTLQIPILLGRNFLPGESKGVIISQSLAQKEWPGENPLGKIWGDKQVVVGVAGSARINALNENDSVEIYFPVQAEDMPGMSVLLRTNGAPDGFAPRLKAIVQNLDPKLFPEITLIRARFDEATKSVEIAVSILSVIGMLAVVLAGLGILGLVAFTISQRSKEIAIRLALGSPAGQAIGPVLRQYAWPVFVGLVLGVALTAGFSQLLRFMLYGISNLDPASYAAALAILLLVVAVAVLLPARKALRIDIARTLHQE